MVVQDLATQWIQSFPCKTKTSQEVQKSLMKFLEPTRKPKVIYTDNSLDIEEFEKVDASEIHVRRLNAKEVLTSMKGGNFIFWIANGTVKLSGASENIHLDPRSPRPRRRTRKSSRKIRRIFFNPTSRLIVV